MKIEPAQPVQGAELSKPESGFHNCTFKPGAIERGVIVSSVECEAQPVQDEISRLRAALKKANDQAEHFEREWYLRGDEIEALKAQPVQPEQKSKILTRPFNEREKAILAPPHPGDFGIPKEHWEAAKNFAEFWEQNNKKAQPVQPAGAQGEPVHFRAVLCSEQHDKALGVVPKIVGFVDKKAAEQFILEQRDFKGWKYNLESLYTEALAAAINEQLYTALEGLLAITRDSQGVAGYHLNGVVAKWDEFEEVSAAEAALKSANQQRSMGYETGR